MGYIEYQKGQSARYYYLSHILILLKTLIMKALQTIILIFSLTPIFSQKKAILNNPDIIWAAEVETDFVVDNYTLADKTENNLIYTLKLIGKNNDLSDYESAFFTEILFKEIFSNRLKIYADSECQKQLDSSILISIDTATNCWATSFSNQYHTVRNKILSSSISEYRLKHFMFYDERKSKWDIVAISVAALVNDYDEKRDIVGKKPIFWFNVINEKPKLSSNDIVWAKRITTKGNSIDLDSVKVFKGASVNPMIDFIAALKNKPKMSFYLGDDFSDKRKLTLYDRAKIISWVDTLTEMKNGEVINSVEKKELDITKIRKLRLVQNWFWDENKKRLSVWLEAVAPMKQEEDEEGNFLYKRALFYQRNDD